jgi:hypothetical protein
MADPAIMSMEIVTTQSNEARLAEARKLAEDPAVVPRKGRSRVTNGKSLFVEFDGRGPWTRRWRDLLPRCSRTRQSPLLANQNQSFHFYFSTP